MEKKETFFSHELIGTIEHIKDRWQQLDKLVMDYSDKGLKFLTFSNGGAAVSTLAFMGSELGKNNASSYAGPVFVYFIGIVLVGFIIALELRGYIIFREKFNHDSGEYYKRKISWETLISNDEKRTDTGWGTFICGIISLGCFVGGSIWLYFVVR